MKMSGTFFALLNASNAVERSESSACIEQSEKCPAYLDRRGFPTPPGGGEDG